MLPELLENATSFPIEPSEATTVTDLQAGPFSTRSLETQGKDTPFVFTLREAEIDRAQVRCIRSHAFVCTGDETFPFFVRIQKASPDGPAPIGELTVETVNFELRPQLRETAPGGDPVVGYELHGKKGVLAAFQTRTPDARIWLSPRLAPNLQRAIASTAFALRLRDLLETPPAPPPEL